MACDGDGGPRGLGTLSILRAGAGGIFSILKALTSSRDSFARGGQPAVLTNVPCTVAVLRAIARGANIAALDSAAAGPDGFFSTEGASSHLLFLAAGAGGK